VLYHAKSILTDRGVMKAELHADTGYFFDDNTRIEMRVVTTYFFTVTGARNAVLTSREGTYNTRSGNMEARGSVVVVTEDGRRLSTPVLRYSQSRNEITSDSAFVLIDSVHRQMTGVGFVSDPNMNQMRCLRACAATAGVVNLQQRTGGDTARTLPSTGARPPSAGSNVPPPPHPGTSLSTPAPARVPPSSGHGRPAAGGPASLPVTGRAAPAGGHTVIPPSMQRPAGARSVGSPPTASPASPSPAAPATPPPASGPPPGGAASSGAGTG
jgi:hypothetical protein